MCLHGNRSNTTGNFPDSPQKMGTTSPNEAQRRAPNWINPSYKIVSLIQKLEDDMNACDFKWTLFVAAANSYKYDSLLKPFPSAYVIDKALNINHLRAVISSVPSFGRLLPILRKIAAGQLELDETNGIREDGINLLCWCLIRAKEPSLKSVHASNVSKLIQYTQKASRLFWCSFWFSAGL